MATYCWPQRTLTGLAGAEAAEGGLLRWRPRSGLPPAAKLADYSGRTRRGTSSDVVICEADFSRLAVVSHSITQDDLMGCRDATCHKVPLFAGL